MIKRRLSGVEGITSEIETQADLEEANASQEAAEELLSGAQSEVEMLRDENRMLRERLEAIEGNQNLANLRGEVIMLTMKINNPRATGIRTKGEYKAAWRRLTSIAHPDRPNSAELLMNSNFGELSKTYKSNLASLA